MTLDDTTINTASFWQESTEERYEDALNALSQAARRTILRVICLRQRQTYRIVPMDSSTTYPCTPLYRVDAVMCAHGFERDGERLTLAYGPTRRQAKLAALRPRVFSKAVLFAPSRWSRCWADVELDTAEALKSATSGECVCPNCGARLPHQAGIPCYNMSCPKCEAKMART